MREEITESTPTVLQLTAAQASVLKELGERLARENPDPDPDAPPSAIDVMGLPGGGWRVTVREAVGVISVDDREIVVRPKIPYSHFLHLARKAGIVPRIDPQRTSVERDRSLWEVVAYWFVEALRTLVRGELAKGYREITDELEFARGRILPTETASAFYAGRPVLACEFEEFTENIALNRVLKAAAHRVAASSILGRDIRHRARSALMRMDGVGALEHSDLRIEIDRLTKRYGPALAFGKIVLAGTGTSVSNGDATGWSFLIRTPDIIEAGIRSTLREGLAGSFRVEKVSAALGGATLTLNPDLVFNGDLAVGDVKYKLLTPEWNRPDLYQSVAFAAGFHATESCLVGFSTDTTHEMPPGVRVGSIAVRPFAWHVGYDEQPERSAAMLCEQVRSWLTRLAYARGGLRTA